MAMKFITISIDIMHDKNLSQSEKFILAEIEQLSSLERGCVASNNHFSELIGLAKESVSRAISKLVEKGYIYSEIKKGSRNHVRLLTINKTSTLNKTSRPPKQNVKTPLTKRQETKGNIHSNIHSNSSPALKCETIPPKKRKITYTDDDMGLAATMYHNILALNNGFKKPNFEQWANTFRMMRELDGRTVDGMDNFLNSLATYDDRVWNFWRGNIYSPESMRKNYDKIVMQCQPQTVTKHEAVNQSIPIDSRMEELAAKVRTDA